MDLFILACCQVDTYNIFKKNPKSCISWFHFMTDWSWRKSQTWFWPEFAGSASPCQVSVFVIKFEPQLNYVLFICLLLFLIKNIFLCRVKWTWHTHLQWDLSANTWDYGYWSERELSIMFNLLLVQWNCHQIEWDFIVHQYNTMKLNWKYINFPLFFYLWVMKIRKLHTASCYGLHIPTGK